MSSQQQTTTPKLILSAIQEVSNNQNFVELEIQIKNITNRPIRVLDFHDFSTENNCVFQMEIVKDGVEKILSDNLLRKKRLPNRSDYKSLELGDSLLFTYTLDMRSLSQDYEKIGKKNIDFGSYSIQIIYKDDFLIRKDAIKSLESNIIEIEYLE